jgi:hypothetical protein
MHPLFQLSTDEAEALGSILAALSERSRQHLSLTDLIGRWEKFATQVLEGYDDSIYEYTNDLSTRDLLQEIANASALPLRVKLLNTLHKYDERFKQATREVPRPLIRNSKVGLNWWQSRIPVKLRSELEADLRSENLIDS